MSEQLQSSEFVDFSRPDLGLDDELLDVIVVDHARQLVTTMLEQYLHIITRLGPLDDGTDERLYYSPFRQKDRPMFFIVVAYHAFANVLLFYRNARRRGLVPEQVIVSETFANREEMLEQQLAQIEGPLTDATSLTPLGRALWEPLRDALHSRPRGRSY